MLIRSENYLDDDFRQTLVVEYRLTVKLSFLKSKIIKLQEMLLYFNLIELSENLTIIRRIWFITSLVQRQDGEMGD